MNTATTGQPTVRPPVTLHAGRLEVAFAWAADRWRHRVVHDGRLVAESVEGPGPDGDPRWPASPALQEISAAEARGRRVLLAVGSAGRSHFSISVATDESLADTVLVEAACRAQESGGWIGTTYRDAAGAVVRVAAIVDGPPPRTLRWTYRVGPGGVIPGPVEQDAPGRPA